jgi:hypothetical protein
LWALLIAAFSVFLAFFFRPWTKGSLNPTSTARDEPPRPYRVVDIPGKGKGVIATRDITRGELLYRESPLFIVPAQSGCSILLIDGRRLTRFSFCDLPVSVPPADLIGSLLPTLSESEHAALFNLSYVRPPPNLSKDDLDYDAQVALAIVQTNGISAGVRGVGVFPNVSRMNHGCSSAFNAVYSWREKERKLVVHAIRPIKQGQEILTAYFDTRRPRHERRLVQMCLHPDVSEALILVFTI